MAGSGGVVQRTPSGEVHGARSPAALPPHSPRYPLATANAWRTIVPSACLHDQPSLKPGVAVAVAVGVAEAVAATLPAVLAVDVATGNAGFRDPSHSSRPIEVAPCGPVWIARRSPTRLTVPMSWWPVVSRSGCQVRPRSADSQIGDMPVVAESGLNCDWKTLVTRRSPTETIPIE